MNGCVGPEERRGPGPSYVACRAASEDGAAHDSEQGIACAQRDKREAVGRHGESRLERAGAHRERAKVDVRVDEPRRGGDREICLAARRAAARIGDDNRVRAGVRRGDRGDRERRRSGARDRLAEVQPLVGQGAGPGRGYGERGLRPGGDRCRGGLRGDGRRSYTGENPGGARHASIGIGRGQGVGSRVGRLEVREGEDRAQRARDRAPVQVPLVGDADAGRGGVDGGGGSGRNGLDRSGLLHDHRGRRARSVPDGVVSCVGDVDVPGAVDRDSAWIGELRRRSRAARASHNPEGARERGDVTTWGDQADGAVAGVGDVEVARRIDGKSERALDEAQFDGAVGGAPAPAGKGGDDRRGRDLPEREIVGVGDVEVTLRVDDEAAGEKEGGPGPGPVHKVVVAVTGKRGDDAALGREAAGKGYLSDEAVPGVGDKDVPGGVDRQSVDRREAGGGAGAVGVPPVSSPGQGGHRARGRGYSSDDADGRPVADVQVSGGVEREGRGAAERRGRHGPIRVALRARGPGKRRDGSRGRDSPYRRIARVGHEHVARGVDGNGLGLGEERRRTRAVGAPGRGHAGQRRDRNAGKRNCPESAVVGVRNVENPRSCVPEYRDAAGIIELRRSARSVRISAGAAGKCGDDTARGRHDPDCVVCIVRDIEVAEIVHRQSRKAPELGGGAGAIAASARNPSGEHGHSPGGRDRNDSRDRCRLRAGHGYNVHRGVDVSGGVHGDASGGEEGGRVGPPASVETEPEGVILRMALLLVSAT